MKAVEKKLRLDNVLIVVDDIDAVSAFFQELGMEVQGATTVEGQWVDRVIALDGVHADIVTLRTPDGHGRVELTKFRSPQPVRSEPEIVPSNAFGLRRIMFEVADVDELVGRLRDRHGATLVGQIAQYENAYRLCFLRGPEGIVVGLAQRLQD